jgi:polyhydroxyalkanoate synthesis regulator phasin
MDERLKNLLYMGVGLASTSAKAKQLLEKMNVEGRLTEEEGKRIIDELFQSGKNSADEMKEQVSQYLAEMLSELQTPSQKAFNDLEKRVAQLEAILNSKKNEV